MIPISAMASRIQPSATLAAGAKAKQLKAEGVEVFDFSLGEPDFSTPEHIQQAAVRAMKKGHTRYTPASGIPELRKAISNTYKTTYGVNYPPDQIVVSSGAKHAISTALAAVCGPGDEVVIPSPYWVSYSDIVEMTGASYVLVPTKEECKFKMSPGQLKSAITPKSKLLMLNSPCNPTGTTYTRAELEALADVVLDSKIAVMSDEIYERLTFGDVQPTCFASLRPELRERTITISGVSKTYAMTGWRMGWACGPAPLIKAMSNIQSQQTGSSSSISQYAALAALEGDQDCVETMRQEFEVRRSILSDRLYRIPGLTCPTADGGFYAFINVSAYFGKTIKGVRVDNSAAFCQLALESAQVNLVPGSAFGAEGYVRLSFATSREQIHAGLDRLEELLKG